MLKVTNIRNEKGPLKDIIKGKDVFIGVSGPGAVTKEMVESMSEKPIILAMANPTPEIMPEEAKLGGAFIMGTGRSDFLIKSIMYWLFLEYLEVHLMLRLKR